MQISFELAIALKYLFKKKERFISISAALAITGMIIGTGVLILAMSLANGFNDTIKSKILGIETSVKIASKTGGLMKNNNAVIKKVEAIKGVKAVFATLRSEAILSSSSKFGAVIFEGVRKKFIDRRLKKKSLKLHIGDSVKLIIPFGNISPFGLIPKTVNLKVSGIFQTGFYQYDHAFVFMPLTDAQKILEVGDMIDSIDISMYNPYQVSSLVKTLSRRFSDFRIISHR